MAQLGSQGNEWENTCEVDNSWMRRCYFNGDWRILEQQLWICGVESRGRGLGAFVN